MYSMELMAVFMYMSISFAIYMLDYSTEEVIRDTSLKSQWVSWDQEKSRLGIFNPMTNDYAIIYIALWLEWYGAMQSSGWQS